jgi:hypothetical protein
MGRFAAALPLYLWKSSAFPFVATKRFAALPLLVLF